MRGFRACTRVGNKFVRQTINRRASTGFSFANEQRRKEDADEEEFGVFRKETRTIRRNSSGINGDTRVKMVEGTGRNLCHVCWCL